jgi:hypothetical protein
MAARSDTPTYRLGWPCVGQHFCQERSSKVCKRLIADVGRCTGTALDRPDQVISTVCGKYLVRRDCEDTAAEHTPLSPARSAAPALAQLSRSIKRWKILKRTFPATRSCQVLHGRDGRIRDRYSEQVPTTASSGAKRWRSHSSGPVAPSHLKSSGAIDPDREGSEPERL